ncbi:MAG: hypothetical protein WCT52_03845 [Candidatus Micrarchaeia archaeon]
MKATKGQYFSFDAIIATVIMVLATTTLISYWFGVQSVVDSRNSPLHSDAMRIAESLVTPGVPANWSLSSVGIDGVYQIGLTNGYTNELNMSKIDKLALYANPSGANYGAVGRIMRAPTGYYIRIEHVNCSIATCPSPIEIGNASILYAPEITQTAVAHRGGSLDGKPVRIRVFLGR